MFINKILQSKSSGKFRTSYPILVIESDDWGTIRMPSKQILQQVEAINPNWTNDPYLQFDCLESNEDVEHLCNTLISIKDAVGNPCIITTNCIGVNPDFEAIALSDFRSFVGEDFRITLNKYPNSYNVYNLFLNGIRQKVLFPQFHGREHIQIYRYINALQMRVPTVWHAFKHRAISFFEPGKLPCIRFYMDAMNPVNRHNLNEIINICKDGLTSFEKVWGYASKTMIAPCYFWHTEMEGELKKSGILAFQGLKIQKQSKLTGNCFNFSLKHHRSGDVNSHKQYYIVRNAFFEPALDPSIDWISKAFMEIERGIFKQGFAVLSSHRLNYIGAIDRANRETNLRKLEILLERVKSRFPDIQFKNSAELAALMESNPI